MLHPSVSPMDINRDYAPLGMQTLQSPTVRPPPSRHANSRGSGRCYSLRFHEHPAWEKPPGPSWIDLGRSAPEFPQSRSVTPGSPWLSSPPCPDRPITGLCSSFSQGNQYRTSAYRPSKASCAKPRTRPVRNSELSSEACS